MYDLKALVYGAAVGDALGVPFEFQGRNTFRCTHMSSGGVHGMPAGTFSDDTSLLIATCDAFAPAMAKSIPTTCQIAFATGSTTETTPSMARYLMSAMLPPPHSTKGAASPTSNPTATARLCE